MPINWLYENVASHTCQSKTHTIARNNIFTLSSFPATEQPQRKTKKRKITNKKNSKSQKQKKKTHTLTNDTTQQQKT